jgi:hypothetical protein
MYGTTYTGGNPMNAQTPAQGISIDKDFGDAKVFNVECDCTSDDHAVKMWIEVQRDKDIPDVEISFYVTTWTPLWNGWFQRLKAVYDILVKGVHKQEHHMVLSKQSALNFAAAVESTVKELEAANSK